MKNRFCILFAGAIGSSKTPIANYLSGILGLPSLSNDIIRREIVEDLKKFSQEKYLKRRDERLLDILRSGSSFIFDASIDRSWEQVKTELEKYGYEFFIISLNPSKKFLKKLWEVKNYSDLEALDRTFVEHKTFLNKYQSLIGLNITDKTFNSRIQLSFDAITKWMKIK